MLIDLHLQIDFFAMPVNTLRRYKRYYKLQTRPGMNKAQLAEVKFYFTNNMSLTSDNSCRSLTRSVDSEEYALLSGSSSGYPIKN